ncbi:MAG: M48 family metalloprotease [Gaiellaceae bacterium]|jgi:heat shock protein HtpX
MGVRPATARNLFKLWLLLAVFALPSTLIGVLIGGWDLGALFLFAALLTAATVYSFCDRFVLSMLGARELLIGERPALFSTVERLAAVARVAKPRIYLIPDGYPRSLSVGRGPAASTLVFSLGLLMSASPAELDGLIAHELAHIRNRDVAVQTASVAVAATIVELTHLGGFTQRVLLFLFAPVAAAVENLLLSPKREFAADLAATRLCGSPHGLADALVRVDHASELVSFAASPTTEPLYPVNPFGHDDRLARMFETHPPFAERIRRLRQLDPDWHEKLHVA